MISNTSCKQYWAMELNAMTEHIVLLWTWIWSVCMQTQEHQAGCFWLVSLPQLKIKVFPTHFQSDSWCLPCFYFICWLRDLKSYGNFVIMFSRWPWISKVAQREGCVIEETWEMGLSSCLRSVSGQRNSTNVTAPGHQPANITFE